MEGVARNPYRNADHASWRAAQHPSADRYIDPEASESERVYAMFTHLTSVLGLFVGLPVLAALVMWTIRRKDSPFLDDHGREAVHFQLSLVIYAIALVPIAFVTLGLGAVVGGMCVLALGVVGTVLAAQAAHRGEYYRYPMTLRLF
ncbi:MAG: DUF4870 domain-containing protein [Phycisphaeraceae bacterium]|nr:DUF4870 domain-containing protein [Phycisphaeraceae bacterium]MCW5767620.1 DUF4870 domain-containing protein [Phycisphaeraceae bacterium]